MIDIHSHILPGIDDGSESMDESLDMIDIAASGGVRAMAATCHSNQMGRYENFESPELKERFRLLTAAVKKEKIPVTLVRGMEIFMGNEAVDKMKNRELISLNGSGFYLVEFAFDEHPTMIHDSLREMIQAGCKPVLAHPERYFCVQDDPNHLYEWRMMGVLAQMNKGSIFGRFGRREARTAEIMLKNCLVSCIASDAHGSEFRTPEMGEMARYLRDRYSEEDQKILMEVVPSRILMGQPLPKLAHPIPVERKKWF